MYAIPGVSLEPPAPLRKVPVLTLRPRQVVGLRKRLQAFWHRFAPRFQLSVQQALKEDAPLLTVSQARLLWQAVLPKPVFDVEAALQALRQIQRSNHTAYLSHRKRILRKLNEI